VAFLTTHRYVVGPVFPTPKPDALMSETLALHAGQRLDAGGRVMIALDLAQLESIPEACSVGFAVVRDDLSVMAYSDFARLPPAPQ
jgi:hypothetical protein